MDKIIIFLVMLVKMTHGNIQPIIISSLPVVSGILRFSTRSDIVRQSVDDGFMDNTIIFPTQCGQWGPVRPEDLRCPTPQQSSPEDRLVFEMGAVYHPNPSNNYIVNGHLCLKQRWSSICQETWYFSTTESNKIDDLPITDAECQAAIVAFKSGENLSPFFPPFYCSWASTQTNSKDFIIIEQHNVQESIYNMTFLDPLFLNGVCNQPICKTIHPELIWVMENEKNRWDLCNIRNWEAGTLHSAIETKDDSMSGPYSIDKHWIRSSIYGIRRLQGSCLMGVCNKYGIRFASGEWWGLDNKEILKWAYRNFKVCGKGTRVSFHHDNHDERVLEDQYVARSVMCSEIIGRILVNEHVSPMDLSLLIPSNPGKGRAYKIYKRVLNKGHHGGIEIEYRMEKADCTYHILHNTTRSLTIEGQEITIGEWFNGELMKLNVSTNFSVPQYIKNDTTNQSRDGWFFYSLNGYTKFSDKVYSPDYMLSGPVGVFNYSQKGQLFLDTDPQILRAKDQMDLYKKVYLSEYHTNSTSIGEQITHIISRAKNAITSYFSQFTSVMWWIVTGVLSLIAIILIKRFGVVSKIKKIAFKNNNKSNNKKSSQTKTVHIYETITPKVAHGKEGNYADFM
ncbi:glycoprotein [Landjia virus]|uniref:Glycoprotein n=1 Tax=Landjia virus TaxID=1272947 RepID=A0A0D3R1Z3_9RHAB|nr:glycoprotein [Landjia virus]AJR28480.1 glycoprotein [Landjia virus]